MDGNCVCDPKVSKHEVPETYPNESFYEEGKCAGRPGFPCIDSYCVSGASCRHKRLDYTGWLAGDDGKLVCECGADSYLASDFGACLKRPGVFCSGHHECYPGLLCRDQKCSCLHSFQTFSNEQLRCLSFVGEPCDAVEDCIENATCSSIGLCLCKKPQIGTRIQENVTNCIPEHGRNCRKIACACPYEFQVYSVEKNVCQSIAEGDCDGEAECPEHSKCSHNNVHAKNKYNLINGFVGKCACEEGYEINHFEECRVPYLGNCNDTRECDRGLHCIDDKCQCEFSRDYAGIYNRKSRKCLLLVGSKCGEPTDYACVNNADCAWKHWSDEYKTCICDAASGRFRLTGQKTCKRLIRAEEECNESTVCVENAFCSYRNASGVSKCKCKQSFERKSNGECRKPYWGLCARKKQCDFNLTCTEGRCRCQGIPEETTFNFTSRKCELLIGTRCGQDVDYACVKNAECMWESVSSGFPTCSCDVNRYDISDRKTCTDVKTVKGIIYRTMSYLYDLVHAKSRK
ncbi:unnamed protein product [Allacma fusca]|uniref:Uncharacterized protein n=1 Tax=Allacma fusca TaxID=39272 RepID=A0A8J2NUP6_9HEXA|nr:unnamed protein product [Allacma fusca]